MSSTSFHAAVVDPDHVLFSKANTSLFHLRLKQVTGMQNTVHFIQCSDNF